MKACVVVLMLSDVTQRRAAEQALRQSEARFRSLTELSADWYWEQDEQFSFTFVSDDATQRSGYPGARSLGFTRWDHPGIDLHSADWRAHQAVCRAQQPFREFITAVPILECSVRWVSVSREPFFDEQGHFKGYRGIGSDVTARKRIEQQITRTKDLYAALSKTNQAIIHIKEPDALCREVCRIAVEYGHFCLVWIGLLDEDSGWMEPRAVEGPASEGYPPIRVSIDPNLPEGQGFSGAALREGRHYVVNDFFAHARIAPWAKQAGGRCEIDGNHSLAKWRTGGWRSQFAR
jgi:PAS domain S-box-containing protein